MVASVERFREQQRRLHDDIDRRWPNAIADAYDLLAPVTVSRTEVDAIFDASGAIARIYTKIARLLPRLPAEVVRSLGCSPSLLRLCLGDVSSRHLPIARLDVVATKTGVKLLDFNADAPGLLIEAAVANEPACRLWKRDDLNQAALPSIRRVLLAEMSRWRRAQRVRGTRPLVVRCGFPSRSPDQESLASFYARLCSAVHDARPVPMNSVSARGGVVRDADGRRVDVLVRCCELSYFADRSEWAGSQGREILNLAAAGKLCLINPLRAHLFESKAIQAVIWGLFERNLMFTQAERAIVGRHFLPTYFRPTARWRTWVEKPAMGRCGYGVQKISEPRQAGSARGRVFQQYVTLPRRRLMTEDGPRDLVLVTSCLLVHGQPVAVTMRAGGPVTDEMAWSVPVGLKRKAT